MEKIVVFAALVAAVFSAPEIDFKPYDKTAASMFLTEDKNEDGVVSRQEVEDGFVIFDFNKDGVVERLEYTCYQYNVHPALGSFSNALFDEYDANHDHHLQAADLDQFYGRMDTNHDLGVSLSEFVTFWTKLFKKYENYHINGAHHIQHEPKVCKYIHNNAGR